MHLRRVRSFVLLCMALCAMLSAQSDSGSIVGFVKDPSGGVVPKAKISVKNESTGIVRRVETNEGGYYVVPNLQPGLYTVSAEASGFKRFESTSNKLDSNSTLAVDASLTVGTSAETVEVTASATSLQTESAAVQKLVTRTQIDALELNGRNPLLLASIQPGMRQSTTTTAGDFSFSLTNGGYSANGARSNNTQITFDGAPALRTRGNSTSIGVADVDSTEEIQIMTSNFDAEYVRASGAQIRIVTKGGSQDFHAAAYEYFRNSVMNANTWSRNQSTATNFASPFRYNQFGFNVGGPVVIPHLIPKGKMFFFIGQEWVRYRNAQTQTQEVPSLKMRQGDFSELLGPNIFYSTPKVIYDPRSCPSVGASTCVPFSGNIIPATQLSHNGLAILNMYPAPNYLSGNQNWILALSQPENQRKGTYNSDILPTQNDKISFRRTELSYYELDPFDQGTNLTPKSFNRPNQANSLSYTHTFGPTLLNEARATVSLDDVYIPVDTSAPGFNRSTFGINYPFIFPTGKDIPGKVPSVTIPNIYSFSAGPYPSHSTGPIYTVGDTVTKVWRTHTFKAGFYFERSGENDGDQINVSSVPGGSNNQNGNFVFSDARAGLGATSGVGMANAALGLADSYTEIGPRAYTIFRGFLYEWFAQDSWKVNQRLTVNYGVRQTVNIPYKALWGNQIFFDPALYNPAQAPQVDKTTGNVIIGTGNPYDGMVIPGNGWPSSACGHGVTAACGTQYNGLFQGLPDYYVHVSAPVQPRVGLAYQVNDKTVVRAGIGRYVTRFGLFDNVFPGATSPFQPFVTVNNVSVDNPAAALGGTQQAAITVTTLARDLKPPEAWSWNFTVQRQLPWQSVLEVAYIGRRGLHEPEVVDINQPQPGTVVSGVNVNYVRPYKGFSSIQMEESVASSTYKGLQVSWNRRFTQGRSFGASYTLSKSMDNSSNYRDIVPDSYNTSNMWGPSEYDTRHILAINYVYELPFFKDRSKMSGKLLGGWQISGVNQFQSGSPCGVFGANDIAQVGEVGSLGCGQTSGQFYVMNGDPSIVGQFAGGAGASSPNQWFAVKNADGSPIFTAPTTGTFNLQKGVRDAIYQPGYINWNLGLYKKFALSEKPSLQFRAEAFDVTNHPNWNTVSSFNPTSSTFGKVTSKTNLARNLQLSLRYAF